MIKFNYMPYNEKENQLYSNIFNYDNSENLIVVENDFVQKFYFSYINSKKMIRTSSIISFNKFWDYIFISKRKNLKDIKKYFVFYSLLDDEIKKKYNISSYFDSMELANDFFEFFKYIEKKEELKKVVLSKWQEEKFSLFFNLKNKLDNFLDENNYILEDWLDRIENLNFDYLKKFKKIIFYDIVDFPHNFKSILKEIAKKNEIEFAFQIEKNDINEKELLLEKISLPNRNIKLNLISYTDDLDLQVQVLSSTTMTYFAVDKNKNHDYKIFDNSNKYILNDTKFYTIIESLLNLSLASKEENKNYLDIVLIRENIFKNSFMEFFGLDGEDIRVLNTILKDEYRYLSLELIETSQFTKFFEENMNLKLKLKTIFELLIKINTIKNISELNEFLCLNFFNTEENIQYFTEGKFETIYDKIYEILGLLSSNESVEFFKDFRKIFKDNLGKNIFSVFFNALNNITLYSNEEKKEDKPFLKDLYTLKMLSNDKFDSVPSIIYADNKTLPKVKANINLFTESQKKKLSIITREEEILIQKYRFFQNILNLEEMNIYSLKNEDENIDYSPFIYELINKYSYVEQEKINLNKFFKSIYLKNKRENIEKNIVKYSPYKKEKTDFVNNKLYIGAYDYIELEENETFFFLDKICGVKSSNEAELENGISARILGILVHKSMEEIFKDKWKDILNDRERLLIKDEDIKPYIKRNIKKEELKIERFLNAYVYDIILERLSKNIEKFFKCLYEELKDKKIIRVETEKSLKKNEEKVFYDVDGIDIILTGRADLIIETDRAKYIIDFKTGGVNEKQLEYYAIMFYESETLPVYSASYNFWIDEQPKNKDKNKTKSDETKDFDFSKYIQESIKEKSDKFKEKLTEFIRGEYYTLPKRKALKKNAYDFKEYYNYKNLIPLEKMGDNNEK